MTTSHIRPQSRDIILFDEPEAHQAQNIVRSYLSYLKFNKFKGPYRFCYVQSDYELIESMTLRENIYIDSIPVSLTQSRDRQFQGQIKKQTNNHLLKLLNGIDCLEAYPSHADQRSRKILGLSKALMQDVDYLFFDTPEKHLNPEDLELFIQALHFHLGLYKKIVFLHSKHHELWLKYVTKRVSRDQNKNFTTHELVTKELETTFLRKTLTNQNPNSEPGLNIRLHNWSDKKAA